MRRLRTLEIENLVDKIFDIFQEAEDGYVPNLVELWHLQAMCRSANFSEEICSNMIAKFRKVLFVN